MAFQFGENPYGVCKSRKVGYFPMVGSDPKPEFGFGIINGCSEATISKIAGVVEAIIHFLHFDLCKMALSRGVDVEIS